MLETRGKVPLIFLLVARCVATAMGLSLVGAAIVLFTGTDGASQGLIGLFLVCGLLMGLAVWLIWQAALASRSGGWRPAYLAAGAVPLSVLGFGVVGLALGDSVGSASGIQTIAARGTTVALLIVAAGSVVALVISLLTGAGRRS